MGMVCSQTDAPDLVHRASLHEDAVSSIENELPQLGVLGEFGEVRLVDDAVAVLQPERLVEIGNLSAEVLGLLGVGAGEDLGEHGLISEESSLGGHHVMLRCGVKGVLDIEGGKPPLAKTGFGDASVCWRSVAPEEKVLEPFSLLLAHDEITNR